MADKLYQSIELVKKFHPPDNCIHLLLFAYMKNLRHKYFCNNKSNVDISKS